MRILDVRFKNLNSLAGEWQVDFTHPAYASDGIFAITGPTGAGKTTIMDAICLALYGSTPRLGKVTKSGNEIMSRQTGECFAEVTFETAKGRYRCHWSQHRARKNPDGELQQARHEIADADSGRVLESKINQVGEFIDRVTGMDFGRFTRSMLLAQGGFAVFLQASPSERSPILEQITGTEIYSRISMHVHERRAAELEKCELMQAELKGIRVLGEEEEREQQDRLKEKQGQEAGLAEKMKELARALTWVEGMAALERELGELEKKQQAFEERRHGFAADAERLEKARKALGLEGDYRSITDLRALQARESEELQAALAVLPEKEKRGAEALAPEIGRRGPPERGANQAGVGGGGHQEGPRSRRPPGRRAQAACGEEQGGRGDRKTGEELRKPDRGQRAGAEEPSRRPGNTAGIPDEPCCRRPACDPFRSHRTGICGARDHRSEIRSGPGGMFSGSREKGSRPGRARPDRVRTRKSPPGI